MAERHYVSKKNETVRMFESDFVEFFSRVHPAMPPVLYLPVVAWMLYAAIWQRKLSILAVSGLFLLGFRLFGIGCVCRSRLRLCLLRHAPLRNAPFFNETRSLAVAEAVSPAPSLQGR